MATERDNSLQFVSVKLNRKNYSYWSYVMKNFLKNKKIWDISVEPIWYLRILKRKMLFS